MVCGVMSVVDCDVKILKMYGDVGMWVMGIVLLIIGGGVVLSVEVIGIVFSGL